MHIIISERARAMWRNCLASALRTALACTFVGATTFYGPASLLRHVAYPAFSYVTVILIITDATLGDTIRGCWLALYATCQSVGPAILFLWLIGPSHLTAGTTAIAVAVAGFAVVLPSELTHLVAKRIALGQIVLIYVIGYIKGAETQAVMHPLRVAASTALGVVACVLALLLPYPRLASREVKQCCKEISENTLERVKLYIKAFCAENEASAMASLSQANILTLSASKIYQSLKRYQPSMKWERLPIKFWRSSQSSYMNVGDKLQDMEIALRGMEMAISAISSFPVRLLPEEVTNNLKNAEKRVVLSIKRSLNNTLQPSVTPESDPGKAAETFQTLLEIPTTNQELPFYFFLFCLKLLESNTMAEPEDPSRKKEQRSEIFVKQDRNMFLTSWRNTWDSKRIMPATKLSLSLGLAVLFGSMYSKENGYWSCLPVAISLAAAAREATFKVANVKAQGTVIGTVYGVMGCFVFERFLPVRFLSLLPWFVFSSFLSKSRMYGQAGGISAVIGAVLILGRKNFGPPSEFAIVRITETFIGLSCSIMVELLLQPTRASTLAKLELSRSFNSLTDCINLFRVRTSKADMIQSQRKLKSRLNQLKRFIEEAEAEPNFWFLPFNGSCYNKLFGSLSKMADLLHFSAQASWFLGQQETRNPRCKEVLCDIDKELDIFRESMGSLTKSFEEITLLKSLNALEKALAKDNLSWDLEMGKSSNPNFLRVSGSDDQGSETEKVLKTYLLRSGEVVDGMFRQDGEDGEEEEEDGEEVEESEEKREVMMSLSALGFCMKSMMKEAREMEERVKELVQWENPSSHVDLHEISCKIRSIYK